MSSGSRINFRVLQNFTKKIYITKRCVKPKDFSVDYFDQRCVKNGDIMALAWVEKLSEQRAVLKTLLTFFLYSLLHCIIKTFIKFLAGFAFVQYTHHTFSGHLEDISLLFN